MNLKEIEPLLARNGWSLDCESPLELSHSDGSFARGQAAKIVINDIINTNLDAYEKLQYDIADCISFFEEDFSKVVSCFLVLHNPDVETNQLLELSKDEYKFVLSEAQILDPNPAPVITRLRLFEGRQEDDSDDN